MSFRALSWQEDAGALRLLDQRRLPAVEVYLDLRTVAEIAAAIRDMVVRGAPAIGVAAAYGMAVAARRLAEQGRLSPEALAHDDATLRGARPTAVNLAWALERMARIWRAGGPDLVRRLTEAAMAMEAEDIAVNHAISRHAMALLPEGKVTFFHHCNTGGLATVELGTALGIIVSAHRSGREVMAYLDETRPRLQGAKLSAFELQKAGVPHAVVVDGAAPHLMRSRGADLAVVGCDRVAANGDTANKIGTYALALAARDNGLPFYVAAPTSTIDMATADGDAIEIELRDPDEVLVLDGTRIAAGGSAALNPAFDVTPARLITAFITEKGVVYPPFDENLAALFQDDAAN